MFVSSSEAHACPIVGVERQQAGSKFGGFGMPAHAAQAGNGRAHQAQIGAVFLTLPRDATGKAGRYQGPAKRDPFPRQFQRPFRFAIHRVQGGQQVIGLEQLRGVVDVAFQQSDKALLADPLAAAVCHQLGQTRGSRQLGRATGKCARVLIQDVEFHRCPHG
jgi:hypothetical protein